MTFNPLILRRYFVLGTQNVENESEFFDILTIALKYGITAFQYREKGDGALKGAEKYRVAERIRDLTRQYHVPLIIDDDIPLAPTTTLVTPAILRATCVGLSTTKAVSAEAAFPVVF